MAAFNAEDPRFQREAQNAAAKRSMGAPVKGVARAVQGEIAGRHAQYQLGRQQQFAGLALASRLARQRHQQALIQNEQFGRSIGLAESRLGYEKSMFSKTMKDRESALNTTIISGLLGTGYGVLEGRRRAGIRETDAAWRQYQRQQMSALIEQGIPAKSYGFFATTTEEEQ